ncbi:hypothetical protein MYP_4144 [Sporocytophaga myxococcoides]|uniref:Uncharacterized protein n=1 Tax=Sporocytophaga myxococcoides TaxID=153721 RepID=A0A098LKA6_9BACT|nr:hypothetical protein [Sporocytophaga myxococcoides]GAL86914.1 hypothetical protein MYP_4144 [Sporocytophaga myxococcoides]
MKYILLLLSALTSCLDSLKVKNGIAYEASEGLTLAKDSINYDKLFQRLERSEADFFLTLKPVKTEPQIKKENSFLVTQVQVNDYRKVTIVASKPIIQKATNEIKDVILIKEPKLDETIKIKNEIKPIIIKDSVLPLVKPALDTVWTKIDKGDTEFEEMEYSKKTKKKKKFLFFKKEKSETD